MSEIKRFDKVNVSKDPWQEYCEMTETEDGDFVRFDDHAAIVAKLEQELAEAKKAIQDILAAIPAHSSDSGFVIDHCDCDGNYISTEYVDPVMVIMNISNIVDAAIKESSK